MCPLIPLKYSNPSTEIYALSPSPSVSISITLMVAIWPRTKERAIAAIRTIFFFMVSVPFFVSQFYAGVIFLSAFVTSGAGRLLRNLFRELLNDRLSFNAQPKMRSGFFRTRVFSNSGFHALLLRCHTPSQ